MGCIAPSSSSSGADTWIGRRADPLSAPDPSKAVDELAKVAATAGIDALLAGPSATGGVLVGGATTVYASHALVEALSRSGWQETRPLAADAVVWRPAERAAWRSPRQGRPLALTNAVVTWLDLRSATGRSLPSRRSPC